MVEKNFHIIRGSSSNEMFQLGQNSTSVSRHQQHEQQQQNNHYHHDLTPILQSPAFSIESYHQQSSGILVKRSTSPGHSSLSMQLLILCLTRLSSQIFTPVLCPLQHRDFGNHSFYQFHCRQWYYLCSTLRYRIQLNEAHRIKNTRFLGKGGSTINIDVIDTGNTAVAMPPLSSACTFTINTKQSVFQ